MAKKRKRRKQRPRAPERAAPAAAAPEGPSGVQLDDAQRARTGRRASRDHLPPAPWGSFPLTELIKIGRASCRERV